VYLPREDLDRFGISSADLAAPATSEPLRQLLAYEARRAYDYYAQSGPLVGLVAPVGRPVLRAIVGIYRALLDEIARRGFDVAAGRIGLPGWRKAAITLRSLVR
jgi:phytoene synthase